MKKVKIFIGSSIEELKEDRIAIGNFFRQLNDLYLDGGLYFQLIMCEDYDDSLFADGKQSQYDREIMDSALSVFIFYQKIGKYTEHEFSVAYNQFKKELRPKILTVFKTSSENGTVEDGAKIFAEKLDRELKHYYKTYYNVDSLKLWLIMQIKTMGLDQSKVEFVGGKVLVNGEIVASYEQAPAFSKNEVLLEQKAAFLRLNEEYLRLRTAYFEDDENIDLYVQYSTVAKNRAEIEEKIKATEKEIIVQLENIYVVAEKGELSIRQTLGYRFMEMGRRKEALEILNRDEIYSEVENNEREYQMGAAMMEIARKNLETNVEELLQRIKVLSLQQITNAVMEEIDSLYQKACALSRKYGLQRKAFIKYADFLSNQGQDQEAYDFLLSVEGDFKQGASLAEKADFFKLIGVVSGGLNQYETKTEYLLKALKVAEGVCIVEETQENKKLLAEILFLLSPMEKAFGRLKCYEYAKRSVQIITECYNEDTEKYAIGMVRTYMRIGALEKDKDKQWEAYFSAYRIMNKRMDEQNVTDSEKVTFAQLCRNIVKVLGGGFEKDSVKRKLMTNAYVWAKEAARNNPAAYNKTYAMILNDYALSLANLTKEEDLAKKMFLLAMKIYRNLLSQNEWLYLFFYARVQEQFAEYCYNTADAKHCDYFASAAESWRKLENIEKDSSNRAVYKYYRGSMYVMRLNQKEKGLALCREAIQIYKELPENETNCRRKAVIERFMEKYSVDSLE